jgi:Ca-activated chloride channel family protein
MKKTIWLTLILSLFGLSIFVSPVKADGIIIPGPCPQGSPGCTVPVPCLDRNPVCPPCEAGKVCPPCVPPIPCPPPVNPLIQLAVKYHHVTVTIDNQIATTKVDQVFYNPNAWNVEGTYIFPLPQGATVSQFTLWVDGQPVEGKVMDAAQARQVYEEITRQQRDPALLEYVGRGAVQASIFPIPPQGERRIQLEYVQTLTAENGLVQYLYPLNTEKFSSRPIEDVSITVKIASQQPLRAIYSPSHAIQVDKTADNQAVVSYEEQNVRPDADFNLFYSLGSSEAFHLFTYRDPNDPTEPDGFFLMLLAPKPDVSQAKVAKDVILVLDHSGSMDGEKFQQAQAAMDYILNHLNAEDRFGLVAFSSEVEQYAGGLRNADEAPEAIAWANKISARGSTDINRALLEAVSMADKNRPTYLIFLTDGLPTVGETDRDKIIANFNQTAPSSIRMFAFGVGFDVDTYLLDTLTQAHHGRSTYIQPGQNLDEVVSGFYESISTPVLTNLSLDFGSLATYDVYPDPLPDLFAGSQVVIVGRYRQGGTVDVTLKGEVNGQSQTLTFPGQAFTEDNREASDTLASLPRLWATRKVGYLLNKIRLQGVDQESVDQIVKLSIRYGIVTPYTSYLVTEPTALGQENQDRLAQQVYENYLAAPAPSTTGKAAVDQAAGAGGMSQAEQAPALPSTASNSGAATQTVQVIGTRTFLYSQGVWTDTAYDPQTMKPVQVSFLSADYFKLVESRSELASAFALGTNVIVVVDGNAYQVVADNTSVPPVDVPTTSPALTSTPLSSPHNTSVPAPTATIAPISTPDVPTSEPAPWSPVTIAGLLVAVAAAAYLMSRKKNK